MPTRYYIRLPDPATARGDDAELSFHSQGADGFADELQQALRTNLLFERWSAKQSDPDDVDPALGATDPDAQVRGHQNDLHVELEVVTHLPSALLRQRMALLAGHGWQLRDVAAA
ncbi:MAG TPA: hypothetical protein PLN74_04195 [Thermomonas sp.]|jgi:hypothetical protein|nr:hypothetical protein [Thermomonas sp.]HRA56685.1 hypothetical protein [Thermomonas sp.]